MTTVELTRAVKIDAEDIAKLIAEADDEAQADILNLIAHEMIRGGYLQSQASGIGQRIVDGDSVTKLRYTPARKLICTIADAIREADGEASLPVTVHSGVVQ